MKQNVIKHGILISMILLLMFSLAGAASAHNVTISRTITPGSVNAGESFDVVINLNLTGSPGTSNMAKVTENYTETDWIISDINADPAFTEYVDEVPDTYEWGTGMNSLPPGSYQISYTMTVPSDENLGTYTIDGYYEDLDHSDEDDLSDPKVSTTGDDTVSVNSNTPAVSTPGWSTFQKDNYNSGITDEAGPIGNNGDYAFAVFTSSSGMAGIDTTPVVAGDVVYTAAMGKAFAFNKTTGDEIWNTSLSGGFVLGTPVVADGKIFIGTKNGVIAAYDISNGTEAWINSSGLGGDKAQVNTPIVYDEGNIYFGTWLASGVTGSYYCVNATNGSIVWQRACTSNAGYYWSGACVVGDYLVYGGDDGHLVSVNKYTGTAVEDVSTSMIFDSGTGNIRSSLSYDQSTGRLYFSAGSTCYYVGFNPGTGTFVKTVKGTGTMTGDATSTPAVYNGRVYVGCGGSLYCLDSDSLQIIWSYAVGGQVQSSPAISTYYDDGDGEIYIYFTTNDYSSGMYCLKDMPGNTEPIEQFTFFPPGSMKQYSLQGAAISDGMVYYGNDAGYMFGLVDPEICFAANTTYGPSPLTVQFIDKTAGATEWQWDFDNDGNVDSTEQNPVYTYNVTGNYSVNLTITRSTGSVQELKTDYITVIDATPLEDYLVYTNSSTSVTITGYIGPAGDLVIPGEIDGLPVTAIAKNAFAGSSLTSVVVPDSVTSIGAGAFNNCDDLISLDMGNAYNIIQNGLRNCPSLETLTLGSNFNKINTYGIRDCPALNAMIFEGNAPTLSGGWNYNCPNIVMYYYENATGFRTPTWSGKPCYPVGSPTADFSTNGVSGGSAPLTVQFTYTGVGANALSWYFDDDATVDSTARNPGYTYDMPGTYTVSVFVSNPWGSDSELRTDYITVAEARTDGWTYTSDGTSVTITGYSGPDSNVTIPGEIDGLPVTTIGDSACKGLTSLTSVVIPDNVTTIGSSAFYGCSDLTVMVFNGNAPTTVGSNWAYGCTNLVAYYYEGASGFTTPWNDVPCYPTGAATAEFSSDIVYGTAPFTAQFTYTGVGATALAWDFGNDGTVDSTERETSNTYDTVGTYSVSLNVSNPWGSDSEVKTAYITVAEPVDNFTYASDGTSVTITGYSGPGGDVVIPDTIAGLPVTVISSSVFKNVALTSVIIPDSVTTIGSSAFYGCSGLTSVTLPYSMTTIGSSAFYGCSGLTSLIIPDNVTSIGSSAFYGCSGLTSLIIPNNVTSIGDSTFYGCSGLTSVIMPDNVTSIGYSAFRGCSALTSVTIPDSVTSIGRYAFRDCTSLTSVTIPYSVTSIGNHAFYQCTSLTSVTIENSIIGTGMFYKCTGLTSVIIPDSVTSIGSSAFKSTGLISVTIGNVTSISDFAFGSCSALTSVIFTGNAPDDMGGAWAFLSSNLVAYYYEGAIGFTTPTWEGVPCYPITVLSFVPENATVINGQTTEIVISVDSLPAGLAGYNLTVDIDDPTVAEIVGIEYSWANLTENSSLPGTSIYLKALDGNSQIEAGATDVVLATLTVKGKELGNTSFTLGIDRLDDDTGDEIDAILEIGTLEVGMTSVPGQENSPQDLDGDGICEDLSGDGSLSFVDVELFFHHMDWIEDNLPIENFDFNGNGRIDFDDIVDLFEMVA